MALAAPAAHASTASFSGGTVTITAAPGEANDVWVYGELSQYGEISDTAGITPGPGCNAVSPTQVECGPEQDGELVSYGNYDTVVADLGDGDDEFNATFSLLDEVDVKGGDGDDELWSGYADVARLDGGAGDDVLDGTDGDDRLTGGPGDDKLDGDDGSDVVDGGPGVDDLKGDGGLGGSNGNDRMLARDGERDTVSCELGADIVTADAQDVVETGSCESIDVATSPRAEPGGGSQVVRLKPGRSAGLATLAGTASGPSVIAARMTVSKPVARELGLRGRTLARARKAVDAGAWSLRLAAPKRVRGRLTAAAPLTVVVRGSVTTAGGSTPFKRSIALR